jgi:hypothetical protein
MQAAMAGERDPERLWCHAMSRGRALSTLYWMTIDKLPDARGSNASTGHVVDPSIN